MEVTICDITAFDYWRIPPIVQLLIAGEEDDFNPRRIAKLIDLPTFRAEALSTLPLCMHFFDKSAHTRAMGSQARALAPVAPILAANHEDAIDVLVSKQSQRHKSTFLVSHLQKHDLPFGATVQLHEDVSVTCPELTLMQLAARASLERTIMLASEMCGSFAIYHAPDVIRKALLRLVGPNQNIPIIAGWRPLIDQNGNLTSLWQRPPLTTPNDLASFAERSESRRGKTRLLQAASLTKPNAASPFEVQAGMLLGLPPEYGGAGISDFTHNRKLRLTDSARALANRRHCSCDLYWDEGIDLECQSALVHQNERSFLSDSERSTALASMGIRVVPVTYEQINDRSRFDALAGVLADMRGIELPAKTEAQLRRELRLRNEIFSDWESIHLL